MSSEVHSKTGRAFVALRALLLLCAANGCLVDNPAYDGRTSVAGNQADASVTFDARSQPSLDVATPRDTVEIPTMSLPPQVPTEGLIGWWSFDQLVGGVIRDLSGNGLHGNVVGELVLTEGKQGRAASFNGSSYVHVPYKPVLDQISGEVTVAAWVWSKPSSPGNAHMLLSRQEHEGQWEYYGLACDDDAVVMYLSPDTFDHVHETLVLSEWVHAAATFDGSKMRIFINGFEQANSTQSPRWGQDTNGLLIGANQNVNLIEEFFEGDLDSLGLWKRALSAEEINRLATP
jgi:large repetitive protein